MWCVVAEVTVEWNIYCSLLMFFSATLETKANIHKSPYSQCSNAASLTGQQFNQGGLLTDWCAHPESFLDTSAAEMSSFSPMQRSQMTIGLLCQKHQKILNSNHFLKTLWPSYPSCSQTNVSSFILELFSCNQTTQICSTVRSVIYICVIWGVNCHFKDFIQT